MSIAVRAASASSSSISISVLRTAEFFNQRAARGGYPPAVSTYQLKKRRRRGGRETRRTSGGREGGRDSLCASRPLCRPALPAGRNGWRRICQQQGGESVPV